MVSLHFMANRIKRGMCIYIHVLCVVLYIVSTLTQMVQLARLVLGSQELVLTLTCAYPMKVY